MKLPRLSTIAALSTAAGLAFLYAAAARWRDLHLLACARIAELERLLRHERRQVDAADAQLFELTEQLRKARAENGGLVNLSREALRMASDRIDALTEEVRAQRAAKAEPREAEHLRYHDDRIKAAEESGRAPGAVICPKCAAVDVVCFPAVKVEPAVEEERPWSAWEVLHG